MTEITVPLVTYTKDDRTITLERLPTSKVAKPDTIRCESPGDEVVVSTRDLLAMFTAAVSEGCYTGHEMRAVSHKIQAALGKFNNINLGVRRVVEAATVLSASDVLKTSVLVESILRDCFNVKQVATTREDPQLKFSFWSDKQAAVGLWFAVDKIACAMNLDPESISATVGSQSNLDGLYEYEFGFKFGVGESFT